MQRRIPGRNAFTLIELMIAIALGAIIAYVAFAGFRVASQSITVVNRLSLENGMIRLGYLAGLEEIDHWTMYDDPNGPASAQRLRGKYINAAATNGHLFGMPFTPFTSVFPAGAAFTGAETDRGWDSDYVWPANDSRTWYHMNRSEFDNTEHVWGNYELFSHLKTSVNLTGMFLLGIKDDKTHTLGSRIGPYGTATPRHTWLPNQLYALKNALGYYGMCEYMPADTVYGVYGKPGTDGTVDTADDIDQGVHAEWNAVAAAGLGGTAAGIQRCRTLSQLTRDISYAISPGNKWTPATAGLTTAQLGSAQRAFIGTQRLATIASMQDFLKKMQMVKPMLDIKPDQWPDVSLAMSRYIACTGFRNLCKVRWQSPLTGEIVELTFSALGTSLRGARQQRGLDSY